MGMLRLMRNGSRRRTTGALLATSLSVLLLAGCGGDEARPPEEAEPQGSGTGVLTERAKVLDKAGAAALESVAAADSTIELNFSNTAGMLGELQEGDVLIVGVTEHTPQGGLFAIDELSSVESGLVVIAHQAALGDAFEELHLDVDAQLQAVVQTPPATLQSAPGAGLGRVQQAVGETFPFEIALGSGDSMMTLEGSLGLDAEASLELDIDFSELTLDELSLSFSAGETFVAELSGLGATSFEESQTVGVVNFGVLVIPIVIPGLGAIPLVITTGARLEVGIKGSIAGEVSAGVTQHASFTTGVGYIDGQFQATSDSDSSFESDEPSYGAGASIRAWAGPKLEVLIYGAVGPFVGVEAFVEASASVEGDPPCVTGRLDAGLSANAGVRFLADYSTSLFEERFPLESFDSCNPDLDANQAATGWARTYGRAGSEGDRAQAVIQVSDGGYFVVGESSLFDGITGFAASTWALRLDALGNVIWQRAFQRTLQGLARSAAEVPGGFLIVGDTGVLKVDSGGNLLWAKQYTALDGLELMSAAARDDGAVLLAGRLGLAGQALALQIDEQGEVVWGRSFTGDAFKRARITSDGGSILAGGITRADMDFYAVKLDSEGALVWQRAFDNRYDAALGVEDAQPNIVSAGDDAYDAAETPDGGFILVGESYGNFPIPEAASGGYYASAVLELDGEGEIVASNVYRAPSDSLYGAAYAVAIRPNGSSLVVARRADVAGDLLTGEDVLLIQDGAFSVFGGAGNDAVYSGTLSGLGRGMPLQITADGGAMLAVTSDSFAGQDELWLLKLTRTASIDSPYRDNLAGSSFVTEHASSAVLDAEPESVEVEVVSFTADIASEATQLVEERQVP
jgi:hypothetical protein